jgi:hypothetical protein
MQKHLDVNHYNPSNTLWMISVQASLMFKNTLNLSIASTQILSITTLASIALHTTLKFKVAHSPHQSLTAAR